METIKLSETKEVRIRNQQGTLMGYYGQVYEGDFQLLKASPDYSTRRGLDKWITKLKPSNT